MTELLARPHVAIPMNLADGVRIATVRTPNRLAVVQGEKRVTYRDLNNRTNQIGNALRALGLQTGDRVGVVLANVPEYVELVFGIARAGLVVVPVSYRSIASEIAYQLNDSEALALCYNTEYAAAVDGARPDLHAVKHFIAIGDNVPAGTATYEDFIGAASSADPGIEVSEEMPFCIYYTSGTTGLPKGAVVSHRSRVLTFFGMAVEFGCYGPDDYGLGTAPMYHGAGMSFCLASAYFGGTLSLMKGFRPEELLQRLASERCTNVFMVPTMFQAVFSLPEATRDKYDLAALRVWMSNASALAQATKELIVAEWPHTRLYELYGSTEAGIVSALRPEDQLRKLQCVGHPFPLTDVKLLDDDGHEVPDNAVGELFSRSPYLFNGYHGKPGETAAGFAGEYFSAGDLAVRDDEGYLYIVDRKKDMIISGGTNVYPREIEEVLFRHPAVADVAVIGVPDDYWGEAVKAVVVSRAGAAVNEADILAYTEGRLAGYKRPKSVVFVDELPRNAAGKVLKRDLRLKFK